MARPAARHPTELELEILKIIWRDGPSRGREVREARAPRRRLAHTSVITVMKIMVGKGYLRRRKLPGRHEYEPLISRRDTAGRMLSDLVERVFDGSAASVVVSLLETADIDAGELKRLRELIERRTGGVSP